MSVHVQHGSAGGGLLAVNAFPVILSNEEKKKENCKCSKLCLQCLFSPVSSETGYVTLSLF